ncbi:EAL domain-containing protein [Shewanella intestini]|uniref:GGDEF domain-containing protein n=1 Tax=Shewanella intestini TaxID=2017544 RepID=A0ABS5I4P7_9GAMM|nr:MULTISPECIES: GGDEF domain-containing protein [Shewanella]MBR9729002.1 GGDEF domain-containing protein [Shewanella intestini]MRG36932.1 EAL domain-containing protein [Shewanella sp. XMDDZSB0408]
MGISKSFQIIMLVIFGLMLFTIYHTENVEVKHQGQIARAQFESEIKQYNPWDGDGEALYKKLSEHYTFQFFQFVHNDDSDLNFTFGSLARPDDDFASKIFDIQLGHAEQLGSGRVQVRLSTSSVISPSFSDLEQAATLIVLSYIVLMIVFALLVRLHMRRITYAVEYINNIPNLTFQAVELSRFSGVLHPIGVALDNCRSQLKDSLSKVNAENEKLTKAAYQDPVTGFSTRSRFVTYLDKLQKTTETKVGIIAITKAAELANINQLHGRAAGDDYLAKIAICMRKAASDVGKSECYRLSSGDFAIFFENLTLKEGEKYLDNLKGQLDDYGQSSAMDSVAHTGMVPFKNQADPSKLVALADAAVSIAQTLGPNRSHQLEKFTGNELQGTDHWRSTITHLIKNQSMKFFQQPIQPCNNDSDIYRELLARFYNSDGEHLPTSTVIAMSERHGSNLDLDKMIVINAIKLLSENPTLSGMFGINISASTALQDQFSLWLRDILSRQRNIASRLVFEINESGMQSNLKATHNFVNEVHKVGSKVAIERFGLGFTSFKFFREVRPDYIKLDSSYSNGIEQDNNNMFFVRMIVDIAKRLAIQVIATGVERQGEKLTLEKLLVDGVQGYYIAQPEKVKKSI